MKRAILGIALFAAIGVTGCDKTASVQAALTVAGQVVTLAQADLPALVAAGTLTAADATAAGNWLSGASTFISQGNACVGSSGGTLAKIQACVNTIGTGLLSPAEMADLRIISPKAEQKVALYVTAVILAVNGAATIVNAVQTTAPAVGNTPIVAPSAQELDQFKARLHLNPAWGY